MLLNTFSCSQTSIFIRKCERNARTVSPVKYITRTVYRLKDALVRDMPVENQKS